MASTESPLSFRLQALGCVLIVVPIALRVLVATEPVPGWDLDPAIVAYTPAGLGPGTTAWLSVMAMLGAALVFTGTRGARQWTIGLVAVLACTGPLLHALVLHAAEPEQVRTSLDWIAGFLVAGAIASSMRSGGRLYLMLGAFLVSLAIPMAMKGVLQLTVEHSATMADYRLNSDRFLTSRGWAPGSPQALQFERRLRQPEATGWFGLANVYGTFAAATFVSLAVAGWHSVRARSARWISGVVVSGLALSAWSLWASGSKGSWAAAGLGCVVVVAMSVLRKPKLAGWLGLSAIGVPVLAVVARGLVGERLGELSLLFRWFYMQGTARVFGETLPWGPGPVGFKDWYARLKPMIAPEDVLSPHCVLFDYAGTLGLLAIPAIVLVVMLAWRLVPRSSPETEITPEPLTQDERKAWLGSMVLLYALITAAAVQFESALAGAEQTLARVAGLAGGAAVAWAIFHMRDSAHWVFAGAGLVVMAQSQIEMTPTQPASVGLAMALLGLAAASAPSRDPSESPALKSEHSIAVRFAPFVCSGFSMVFALVMAFGPARSFSVWQSSLRDAAAIYATGGSPEIARRAELIEAIGPNPPSPEQVGRLVELEVVLAQKSSELLTPALVEFPDDLRIYRSLIDKALVRTRLPRVDGDRQAVQTDVRRALELSETAASRLPDTSGSWATLTRVRLLARSEGLNEVDETGVLDAMERVLELDPLNPQAWAQAAELSQRFGQDALARDRAARALELSEARRLDPLTQLTERRLRQMRRLVGP